MIVNFNLYSNKNISNLKLETNMLPGIPYIYLQIRASGGILESDLLSNLNKGIWVLSSKI